MMLFAKQFKRLRDLIKNYLSLPAVLWIMLWFSINTGPWVLEARPAGLLDHLHYIRTLFPFLVIFVSLIFISVRIRRSTTPWVGPLGLWFLYGLVGLSACVTSPAPFDAVYWALAYLSVFAAMRVYLEGQDALERAIHLNNLSIFILTSFLIILVIFAREVLFIRSESGLSGYGIEGRMETIGGMPMSRSSGLSRFAAVPGIVSFVLLWFSPGRKRFFWLVPLFSCAMFIYYMQSRGALIGLIFALSFVMYLLRGRKRRVGIILMMISGLLLISELIPAGTLRETVSFQKRGQSSEELHTLTGRTTIWERALPAVLQSPVIGSGFQADRFLLEEHAHNTYLYAFLTGGFTGGLAFTLGMLLVWFLFFRIFRSRVAVRLNQEPLLVRSGGILAFFTVRGIAEVSGSLFNIDFMVMLPVMAYLVLLDRERRAGLVRQENALRSGIGRSRRIA